MQYSQKYPNAKYLEMIDNDILVGKELKPCSFCGELTNFIEINSEKNFMRINLIQEKMKIHKN